MKSPSSPSIIGGAIVDGCGLPLVLSCIWSFEDQRNFLGSSRRGPLPALYKSVNLAVVKSMVRLWLVALLCRR